MGTIYASTCAEDDKQGKERIVKVGGYHIDLSERSGVSSGSFLWVIVTLLILCWLNLSQIDDCERVSHVVDPPKLLLNRLLTRTLN